MRVGKKGRDLVPDALAERSELVGAETPELTPKGPHVLPPHTRDSGVPKRRIREQQGDLGDRQSGVYAGEAALPKNVEAAIHETVFSNRFEGRDHPTDRLKRLLMRPKLKQRELRRARRRVGIPRVDDDDITRVIASLDHHASTITRPFAVRINLNGRHPLAQRLIEMQKLGA
jgi:hypothetical protein